jgi:type I restriction enzyme R subunit
VKGLSEDELELFDLLKKSKLTKDEEQSVKLAARTLITRLKTEPPPVLVQNWHLDAQSFARVKTVVEKVLDQNLPSSYDRATFANKRDLILTTMVDYAYQGEKWASH